MAWYFLGLSLAAERRYAEAVEPIKIASTCSPTTSRRISRSGTPISSWRDRRGARRLSARLEMQPNYAPRTTAWDA